MINTSGYLTVIILAAAESILLQVSPVMKVMRVYWIDCWFIISRFCGGKWNRAGRCVFLVTIFDNLFSFNSNRHWPVSIGHNWMETAGRVGAWIKFQCVVNIRVIIIIVNVPNPLIKVYWTRPLWKFKLRPSVASDRAMITPSHHSRMMWRLIGLS